MRHYYGASVTFQAVRTADRTFTYSQQCLYVQHQVRDVTTTTTNVKGAPGMVDPAETATASEPEHARITANVTSGAATVSCPYLTLYIVV